MMRCLKAAQLWLCHKVEVERFIHTHDASYLNSSSHLCVP